MPSTQSVNVKLEIDTECIDKLLAALRLFSELAADYQDDERFQTVSDKIMAALGYGMNGNSNDGENND